MNSEITRANKLYKQSQEPRGVSQPMRRKYLEESLTIYRSQLGNITVENRSSLWRNIGVASLRLAEILDPKLELQLVIYHLTEAVSNLTGAWTARPKDRATDWGRKIEEYVSDSFERAFRSIDGDVESQRLPYFHLLEKIGKAISNAECLKTFRVRFHLARGQYFYRCGVKTLETANFKLTDRLLVYAREEASLARQFTKNEALLVEIERFEEDSSFLQNSCESVRFLAQGDDLFTAQMNDAEEVNFEMMWEIMDRYKAAELVCREKDLENEAIAVSRQARLYGKVFKIGGRAKRYYREAFDLAQTLHPKDLSKFKWFQECKNALERFQKETLLEEEKKKAQERAPYLAKMKKELDELRDVANKSDAYNLLKHVYKAHPPKTGNFVYKESEVNSENIKKTLMKAITQYHPDKQVNFGMEWKVLSEEITKYLTVAYERFKG